MVLLAREGETIPWSISIGWQHDFNKRLLVRNLDRKFIDDEVVNDIERRLLANQSPEEIAKATTISIYVVHLIQRRLLAESLVKDNLLKAALSGSFLSVQLDLMYQWLRQRGYLRTRRVFIQLYNDVADYMDCIGAKSLYRRLRLLLQYIRVGVTVNQVRYAEYLLYKAKYDATIDSASIKDFGFNKLPGYIRYSILRVARQMYRKRISYGQRKLDPLPKTRKKSGANPRIRRRSAK